MHGNVWEWVEAFWKLLLNKAKKGEGHVNLVTKRLFRCGLAVALSFVVLGMTSVTAQEAVPDETFVDLCENGTVENVRRAIRNGANVNARNDRYGTDKYGWTALMAAARNPNPEVVKVLLEKKANIYARSTRGGMTALMVAARNPNPEVVKVLLADGAYANAKDDDGWTALLYAANGNNPEVMKVLVEDGADINVKDYAFGQTALMLAVQENSDPEVVKMLLKNGADINARDNALGKTALMYAAQENSNPEVVKVLLAGGADARAVDKERHGALWWAQQREKDNKKEIIQILKKYASPAKPAKAGKSGRKTAGSKKTRR